MYHEDTAEETRIRRKLGAWESKGPADQIVIMSI